MREGGKGSWEDSGHDEGGREAGKRDGGREGEGGAEAVIKGNILYHQV